MAAIFITSLRLLKKRKENWNHLTTNSVYRLVTFLCVFLSKESFEAETFGEKKNFSVSRR
jgi:hypothetical protein